MNKKSFVGFKENKKQYQGIFNGYNFKHFRKIKKSQHPYVFNVSRPFIRDKLRNKSSPTQDEI